MCERLAKETVYREATIDTILWRACDDRWLDSASYLYDGWDAALRPNLLRMLTLGKKIAKEQAERVRIAAENSLPVPEKEADR